MTEYGKKPDEVPWGFMKAMLAAEGLRFLQRTLGACLGAAAAEAEGSEAGAAPEAEPAAGAAEAAE